jgi:hypothetical protein
MHVSKTEDSGIWLIYDSFVYRILLKLMYSEIPI